MTGMGASPSGTGISMETVPNGISLSDVNGDGKTDLIVLLNNPSLSFYAVGVFLGNGDGTFQPRIDYPVGQYGRWLSVADVNGDAKPDIIVTAGDGQTPQATISVLLNDGRGPSQPIRTIRPIRTPTSPAVGDINGDGRRDLVVYYAAQYVIRVFYGAGNGTFQEDPVACYVDHVREMHLADVNGDGAQDLVTANDRGGVVVMLNSRTPALVTLFGHLTLEEISPSATAQAISVTFRPTDSVSSSIVR